MGASQAVVCPRLALQLTADRWAQVRKNGLKFPVHIQDSAGLGMVVPSPGFGVRDVARVIGTSTPLVRPLAVHRACSTDPNHAVRSRAPRAGCH